MLEDLFLGLVIQKPRNRNRGMEVVQLWVVVLDSDEARRVGVRQGAQQRGIDHRKDRAVGSDPEGQGQHRRGREARTLAELAPSIAQILQQRTHVGLPFCQLLSLED